MHQWINLITQSRPFIRYVVLPENVKKVKIKHFVIKSDSLAHLFPVSGAWGGWGHWAPCSQSCGGGTRTRDRVCNNPAPAHGGAACPGSDSQTDFCNTAMCPSE